MKNLNLNQMETINGGYACLSINPGQGIGQCYPSLCQFVGGILAGNNSATNQFEFCPL